MNGLEQPMPRPNGPMWVPDLCGPLDIDTQAQGKTNDAEHDH